MGAKMAILKLLHDGCMLGESFLDQPTGSNQPPSTLFDRISLPVDGVYVSQALKDIFLAHDRSISAQITPADPRLV